MKALFVAAGKRLEMAKKFIKAGWTIDAYEYDTNCPLNLLDINIIHGKRWKDPEIYDDIYRLCKNYDLILPFQDEATKILSQIKKQEQNTDMICVSDLPTTKTCLNKQLFADLFNDEYFYPKPYINGPIVIKPISGFGSKGIVYVDNWQGEQYRDCIIQQKIENGSEYSVDCYFDKESNLIDFVPRKRIEVASGEVVKSSTVSKSDFNFADAIKRITEKMKFSGPVCMQFISDNQSNIWIMEINARFGGGCTLTIESGFDIISLLTTEYFKYQKIENYNSTWKSNLHMTRCFVDYCYEKNCI